MFFASPTGNPAAPWNYADPVDYVAPELSIFQPNAAVPPFLAQALSPSYISGATPYLEFAFDLDTAQMSTALGTSPSLKATFEVDWIPAGTRQLTAQCAILVSRAAVVSANPPPVPSASYLTAAQVEALILALTSTGATLSVTASGTQSDGFAVGNKLRTTPVAVTAFTGTANIRVLAANATTGCQQTYIVAWPAASTGITLNFIDDASSATLFSTVGTTLASATEVTLYFNGTNWLLLS